jgi:hypothetical protein
MIYITLANLLRRYGGADPAALEADVRWAARVTDAGNVEIDETAAAWRELAKKHNLPTWLRAADEIVVPPAGLLKAAATEAAAGAGAGAGDVTQGPGDLLHEIFQRAGFSPSAGCRCNSMRQRMNQWGWGGCILHLPAIAAHVRDEARRRGIQIGVAECAGIIRAAIDVARKGHG